MPRKISLFGYLGHLGPPDRDLVLLGSKDIHGQVRALLDGDATGPHDGPGLDADEVDPAIDKKRVDKLENIIVSIISPCKASILIPEMMGWFWRATNEMKIIMDEAVYNGPINGGLDDHGDHLGGTKRMANTTKRLVAHGKN